MGLVGPGDHLAVRPADGPKERPRQRLREAVRRKRLAAHRDVHRVAACRQGQLDAGLCGQHRALLAPLPLVLPRAPPSPFLED